MVKLHKNCPLCGSVLTNPDLRVEAHMAYSQLGSVPLSPAMEAIVRALLREREGLSMYQLFDRIAIASPASLRTTISCLRKRLKAIGWDLKRISYAGNYVLKPVEK